MKAIAVVRLYWLVTAVLLIGWFINLYEALTRPTVSWLDAAGLRLLIIIFFVTVIMLVRARTKAADDVSIRAGRYVVMGLAVTGLVAAALLGAHA